MLGTLGTDARSARTGCHIPAASEDTRPTVNVYNKTHGKITIFSWVNPPKLMGKSSFFMGQIHYFYGKSPFFMGQFTISMVIFHSYVSHYQRVNLWENPPLKQWVNPLFLWG